MLHRQVGDKGNSRGLRRRTAAVQAPRRERGRSEKRQLHTTRECKQKREQKKVREADSLAG